MARVLVLNELHTVIVALLVLGAGATITYNIPFVKRRGMPISVTGGVLVALLVMLARRTFGLPMTSPLSP